MEYITKGNNLYPILTEEEREERHQNFLRIADRIIEKYKKKEQEEDLFHTWNK